MTNVSSTADDILACARNLIIAGGYNKAVAIDSDIPVSNRLLIVMYPSKEASEKANAATKPWAEKVKGKYVDRFRLFGVEGVEQK